VAENLGVITPPVERLRLDLGVPGTVVLQFAFASRARKRRIDLSDSANVVYTGTHDNDTSIGWWASAGASTRDAVEKALSRAAISESDPNWKMIRLALVHPASLAIITVQDLLGLDSSARLNHPGTVRGNWMRQMALEALTPALAWRLRELTIAAARA